MEDLQPGQVISPQATNPAPTPSDGAPEPERPIEQPVPVPTPTPAPEPANSIPLEPAVTPIPTPALTEPNQAAFAEPEANWQYQQESNPADQPGPLPEGISWTASEFIAHDKGIGWYALLVLVALAASALDYFVTKDKISSGVILFAAIVFAIVTSRKPRTQEYILDRQGLQIGQKDYDFRDFKTFSITEEGAIASIVFMPLKRFMPPLTIYLAPDVEEQVVDFLVAFLPFEQHKTDAVDSLLRRIHF